jgi:lambda family phage portal protein
MVMPQKHSIFTAAANTTATWGWFPDVPTTGQETYESRRHITGRAHNLWQNTAIARAIIDRLVDGTVGTGLRLQAQPETNILGLGKDISQKWGAKVEAAFRGYWESPSVSVCGTMNSAELCTVLLTNVLVHGDSGIRFVRQKGADGRPELRIQVIDSMRFESPSDKVNDPDTISGVEVDPLTGAPRAYYIGTQKPNSPYAAGSLVAKPTKFQRYENGKLATDLVFVRQRPGQYRGLSLLTPVVEASKQLQDLMDAGIRGEHVRSAMAFAIEAFEPETTVKELDGNLQINEATASEHYGKGEVMLAHGKVLQLRRGDKLVTLQNPHTAETLKDLSDLLVLTIGAATGVPKGILLQVYETSYTAARAQQLDMDAHIARLRKYLSDWLCSRVYEYWLELQVASGEIDAPGFFLDAKTRRAWLAHEFTGDNRGHIDPVKMANYIITLVKAGLCSFERAMSILWGGDFSTESERIAAEWAVLRDLGLDVFTLPGLPANQGAQTLSTSDGKKKEPDTDEGEGKEDADD